MGVAGAGGGGAAVGSCGITVKVAMAGSLGTGLEARTCQK